MMTKLLNQDFVNNMDKYTCDKCHDEIQKGKHLHAVRINGKLMQICSACRKEYENKRV